MPVAYPLSGGVINEGSGLTDSKANAGFLWVEEDSGNLPQVWLLGHNGTVDKAIPITGAVNRDWEDIALSTGPDAGKNYLYLGDIGDNDAKYSDYTFYRFEEPLRAVNAVTVFDKIVFTYPDGAHDAEAFLVDAATKDIYIITKRDAKSRIFRLAYPQSTTSSNMAVFDSDLNYNGVVSAAQTPDGTGIILKTYTGLFYYTRKSGETIAAALHSAVNTLSYQLEPQGEAVAFANDNTGFYTLSEKSSAPSVSLNFYKKK
ncbi:MAG: hypothetical protein ABI687_07865 [Flavitalea sp.]